MHFELLRRWLEVHSFQKMWLEKPGRVEDCGVSGSLGPHPIACMAARDMGREVKPKANAASFPSATPTEGLGLYHLYMIRGAAADILRSLARTKLKCIR